MALESFYFCSVGAVNDEDGLVRTGAGLKVPVAVDIVNTELDSRLHHLRVEGDRHHVIEVLVSELALLIGAGHDVVELLHSADSGDVEFESFCVGKRLSGSTSLEVVENTEGHLIIHGVDVELAGVCLGSSNDLIELLLAVAVGTIGRPVADDRIAVENVVDVSLVPDLGGLELPGIQVGVLDFAAEELLKSFLTTGADSTVVAVENNNRVARLHAVLLEPG